MRNKILKSVPALTKLSSKGQLVIPEKIRKNLKIKEGDIFATTTKSDLIVLKKIENPLTQEDLKTLKLVEEAWKEIEEGKSRTMEKEKFLEEIKRW